MDDEYFIYLDQIQQNSEEKIQSSYSYLEKFHLYLMNWCETFANVICNSKNIIQQLNIINDLKIFVNGIKSIKEQPTEIKFE